MEWALVQRDDDLRRDVGIRRRMCWATGQKKKRVLGSRRPCALPLRPVIFCDNGSPPRHDAATLARAAQWQRDNPELAERQAEFFHSLWDDPGGAVAKEELLALQLSPDLYYECGICDRDYLTCCAAGARAVGTRRGDGPRRGLAPKAEGATNGG